MLNKRFTRAVLDIETNGLINMLVDYTARPLKLKDHAKLWCISIRDFDNRQDVVSLVKENCTTEKLEEILEDTEELIFHNGIGYDMIMLFLFGIMDYRVGYEGESDTIFKKKQKIKFVDTLLLSKLLRQDRFGGHSVEAWGRVLGVPKIDFHEFEEFSEEMVTYCEGDTLTQASIYEALLEELGEEGWDPIEKAYRMEIKLMDLTMRQELRGFYFDKELAEKAVVDFQNQLDTIKAKVDPLLPARPLNKGEQAGFQPPKVQFKKNGDMSANMLKFLEKVDATVSDDLTELYFEDKTFPLPLEGCIKSTLPGSIDNLDYLKAYLLDLGWDPIEWKERDLTKDSKKVKLHGSKLDDTILRYVDNTLNGPYKKYRLEMLGIKDETQLVSFLLGKRDQHAIVVPVSPMIRIGTEKKLCDNLVALGEQASFAMDVTMYLTLKHRKNSIAGSKENEDGDPLTGFLSNIREDGRIGTPADTLGANGGRYKHRVVCNIPRVSSIGGDVLRALFGCGPGRRQFGFDFASLEARIQGHYVFNYEDGEALAASLIAEKPNDCFDLETQILTKDGWVHSSDLNEDILLAQWEPLTKHITYSKPSQIIRRNHEGTMITVKGSRLDIKVTPNHIMAVYNRDTNEYLKLEARDLKEYVLHNPNSFIPANGYDPLKGSLDYDLTKVDCVIDRDCGFIYKSRDLDTITSVVTSQRLTGSSSLIIKKEENGTTVYQTTVGKSPLNQDGFKLIYDEIGEEVVNEDVWCVTVPTHHVIVKRNNSIYVTGQCHSINARKLGITRDNAKSFSYACMYGAQPAKLAKMLRISLKEAERLYEAYWEAVPALKELKERLENFWKKTGKQYILGIDGRKLYVRSQHSLVNLLLQSAGALCVKYTLVGVTRRLEELGQLGDPLLDTEEDSKSKVYQMIAYHDEAQYDCPENYFKTHYFPTEDEAKAAQKEAFGSSAVGHDNNGYYYTENNTLSQFIEEEIFRVCMDLDIRVPLGMEYITGNTWAECH